MFIIIEQEEYGADGEGVRAGTGCVHDPKRDAKLVGKATAG